MICLFFPPRQRTCFNFLDESSPLLIQTLKPFFPTSAGDAEVQQRLPSLSEMFVNAAFQCRGSRLAAPHQRLNAPPTLPAAGISDLSQGTGHISCGGLWETAAFYITPELMD